MIHRISGLADQAFRCGLRFGRAFHTTLLERFIGHLHQRPILCLHGGSTCCDLRCDVSHEKSSGRNFPFIKRRRLSGERHLAMT